MKPNGLFWQIHLLFARSKRIYAKTAAPQLYLFHDFASDFASFPTFDVLFEVHGQRYRTVMNLYLMTMRADLIRDPKIKFK